MRIWAALSRLGAGVTLGSSFSASNQSRWSVSGRGSVQAMSSVPLTYLGPNEARLIDEELMSTLGFSIDQLMELAGLSVASAVLDYYPLDEVGDKEILIVSGPGNNGGDGLVAARHLRHFGYKPVVVYPKRGKTELFGRLVTQLESLDIEILETLPESLSSDRYECILDCIFGFSFKGAPRAPFDVILSRLHSVSPHMDIVSVDVPSGWDVEEGDVTESGFCPKVLISLTAPKLCSRRFEGAHYLGGRFVPPGIERKYNIVVPTYEAASQVVRLS